MGKFNFFFFGKFNNEIKNILFFKWVINRVNNFNKFLIEIICFIFVILVIFLFCWNLIKYFELVLNIYIFSFK